MTAVTDPVYVERCPHCALYAVTKWPHATNRLWMILCRQCQRFGSGATQAKARKNFMAPDGT